MGDFIRGAARLAGVAALASAAAFGTAQATDWDQLQGDSWSESANGELRETTNEAGQGSLGEAAGSATGAGAEIATAFQGLGMEPARAECYGEILSGQLSPEQQEEAAKLVSAAANGQEVRLAVMDSGPTMVGGFSAADASCPEGMGG